MKKLIFIIFCLSAAFSLQSLSYDFIPLQGAMKEIKTENFVIAFPKHLEERAKRTALYAEEIYSELSPFMEWKPFFKTLIILTDHTDIPNGMAIPIFRNSIILHSTPMSSEITLESQHDPLYSLLVHEMTHILQLDQIRGAAYFWRVFYGKLYFPVINSFRWYQEGTAILAETKFAEGGRLESSYNRAIIHTLALKGEIPSFDRLMLPVVDWPHGDATYHLGARFVEYIYNTYGDTAFREFYKDLSNDFWPFVFLFVTKFKRVYGKSLKTLWDEWKAFEEAEAQKLKREPIAAEQLTELEGELTAVAEMDGAIYLASYSYKNDRALYRYDGSLEKIKWGRFKSILPTNDPEVILYTQLTSYPGGLYYYDIYSYNLRTRIERRLTKRGRTFYLAGTGRDERLFYVTNGAHGAGLYGGRLLEGRLEETSPLELGAFDFIGQPRMDESGRRLLFSGRRPGQGDRLYIYELESGALRELEGIEGKRAAWIDDDRISFVAPYNSTDCLFSYSLSEGRALKLLESRGTIINGFVRNDKIYYVDYTAKGEELFVTAYEPASAEEADSIFAEMVSEGESYGPPSISADYQVKNFNRMRYLWPPVWAFVPYILNSQVLLDIPVVNNIPVVGPQLQIYNRLPLGRFNYMLTVALDYMKWYPENSLALNWDLGFMTINYNWKNWAGGRRIYYFTQGRWLHLTTRYPDRYPISFSNALKLGFSLPLLNYGKLGFGGQLYHRFDEYNLSARRMTNTMSFTEYLSYSFSRKRVKSSRWDRGFSFGLNAIQSPGGLLDNSEYYTLQGSVEGRIPVGSGFFFIKGSGGGELLGKNIFTVGTESFRIGQTILGGAQSSALKVDTKAFSSNLFGKEYKGAAYGGSDIGFDVTIYKRSHYWHFATLGFKELYLRPYLELLYLYTTNLEQPHSFLFDATLEVCVDLFAVYGNIGFNIVSGLSLGYKTGESLPAFNYFFYFNVGL